MSIYTAQRVGGRWGALVGGLAFILPGLIAVLAIAALALGDAPPAWVEGFGAGAAAAVVAVVVQAGLKLIDPARAGSRTSSRARSARSSPARTSSPCCCCAASPQLARHVPALGRLARAGLARGQGRRAVLRRRLRDHPADVRRRRRGAALDDRAGVRQRRRLRADHARPGHAHRRARRLRRRPGSGRRSWPPRSPSRPASRWSCSARRTSSACARAARARDFLDGAGPAAAGAILGAAVPLLRRDRRHLAVGRARRRGRSRCSRVSADLGARRRRAGRARHYALAMDLQDEAVEVLSKLIQFHTVNPPGNERECQEWLADYLSDAGLEVELDGAEPERPNLVATLRGGDGPALGYLSHVDTVLADAEDWSADPWGAELRDGYLYGRGAIDMKSQTAAEAVAAAHLARSGAKLQRHAEGHQRRRRGDRRGPRRQVDHREPAGPVEGRLPAQRGRGRGHALRRPPPVRRLRGREGHVPLQRLHHRHRGPRLRPRAGRRTRCSSSRR